MKKLITKPIVKLFSNFGYDILKHENPYATSQTGNWLEKLNIETIIDVGANEGQFIHLISKVLPGKKIIAFEPIKSCFENLVTNTRGLNVQAFNCGLSDHNGTSEINISENFVSSSILPINNLTTDLYPDAKYVNKQMIEIKRLDDVLGALTLPQNMLLKIDVQGYEDKVLAGGTATVKKVAAVIIETSYRSLYAGQWLFEETYNWFTAAGFKFAGVIDQARSANTGIPIYGDAIFIRKDVYAEVF